MMNYLKVHFLTPIAENECVAYCVRGKIENECSTGKGEGIFMKGEDDISYIKKQCPESIRALACTLHGLKYRRHTTPLIPSFLKDAAAAVKRVHETCQLWPG